MRFQDLPLILDGKHTVGERQLLDNFDRIEEQAQDLHSKHRDREYETVLQNCFDGTSTEIGVMNALNRYGAPTQFNPHKFDSKRPETFAYDLVSTLSQKMHYWEIKSMDDKRDMKYFSFNINSRKGGLDLTTYLYHGIKYTDFLILAAFEEDKINCSYDVYPKYAFDSKLFKEHVKRSTGGHYSHYVDITKMIDAGACLLIQ
jgi:hypothetical protein